MLHFKYNQIQGLTEYWEEWQSLLTATNSSDCWYPTLWIAPSWMPCTHITWAVVALCEWPALRLPAMLSLGTRWMTYSLVYVKCLSQAEERAGGLRRWDNHLHKRTEGGNSGCSVCSWGHSSTGAQMQKLEHVQQNADNVVTGVFSRLMCLLHELTHTYKSKQRLLPWISFKHIRQWAWLILIHFSF